MVAAARWRKVKACRRTSSISLSSLLSMCSRSAPSSWSVGGGNMPWQARRSKAAHSPMQRQVPLSPSPLSPITLLHPHFLFTVSPDHSTKTDQPWSAEHSTNITGEQTLCDVGPLVSRKSQFLPAFTRVLQSGFTCHKERTSSASYVPGEEGGRGGASERASEED
jgi:hypothetical protein